MGDRALFIAAWLLSNASSQKDRAEVAAAGENLAAVELSRR
jgi:hypothetical protein